jgi:hypothetical protein
MAVRSLELPLLEVPKEGGGKSQSGKLLMGIERERNGSEVVAARAWPLRLLRTMGMEAGGVGMMVSEPLSVSATGATVVPLLLLLSRRARARRPAGSAARAVGTVVGRVGDRGITGAKASSESSADEKDNSWRSNWRRARAC